jgi:hypothetical protein
MHKCTLKIIAPIPAPNPEDTTWTYNSQAGTLCATTPDGEVSCTQYEAGHTIPCEDFEAPEFAGQVECND